MVRRNPWHSPSYDFMGKYDSASPVGGGGSLAELWNMATFELEDVVILVDFKGVGKRRAARYTPQTLANATCVRLERQVFNCSRHLASCYIMVGLPFMFFDNKNQRKIFPELETFSFLQSNLLRIQVQLSLLSFLTGDSKRQVLHPPLLPFSKLHLGEEGIHNSSIQPLLCVPQGHGHHLPPSSRSLWR